MNRTAKIVFSFFSIALLLVGYNHCGKADSNKNVSQKAQSNSASLGGASKVGIFSLLQSTDDKFAILLDTYVAAQSYYGTTNRIVPFSGNMSISFHVGNQSYSRRCDAKIDVEGSEFEGTAIIYDTSSFEYNTLPSLSDVNCDEFQGSYTFTQGEGGTMNFCKQNGSCFIFKEFLISSPQYQDSTPYQF